MALVCRVSVLPHRRGQSGGSGCRGGGVVTWPASSLVRQPGPSSVTSLGAAATHGDAVEPRVAQPCSGRFWPRLPRVPSRRRAVAACLRPREGVPRQEAGPRRPAGEGPLGAGEGLSALGVPAVGRTGSVWQALLRLDGASSPSPHGALALLLGTLPQAPTAWSRPT